MTPPPERIEFFLMIADPVRHAILQEILEEGELSVSDLLERLKAPQTLVSYHLRCLRECGLVNIKNDQNDRRRRIYYLHDKEMIHQLFTAIDTFIMATEKTHRLNVDNIKGQNVNTELLSRIKKRVAFFVVISDPIRHAILHELATHSKMTVSQIVNAVQRPQTLISYHLRELKKYYLVKQETDKTDKRRKWNYLTNPQLIKMVFSIADDFLSTHEICKTYPACKIKNRSLT